MSTLSFANVRDINLVLKERTHKIKIKYSMHQYSNSYAYFRQLAYSTTSLLKGQLQHKCFFISINELWLYRITIYVIESSSKIK